MSENDCQYCQKPVGDGAALCDKDTRYLRQHLQTVPTLVRELRTALSKQAVVINNHPAPPEDETRLPYNLGASRVLDDLAGVLLSWVKLVHEEKTTLRSEQLGNGPITYWEDRWPMPRTESPSAYAGWLIPHLDWLRRHDAAGDCRDEVAAVVFRASRVIDRDDDRLFIGTCRGSTTDDPGFICPEQLYAAQTDTILQCRRCGTTHDVEARRESALTQAEDKVETAATIARALARAGMGITGERIYNWSKRDKLETVGRHSRTGKPLYRVGDVMDLWAEMEAKRPQNTKQHASV